MSAPANLPVPLLAIVVGAHAHAEHFDRPLAYRLREAFVRRLHDEEVIEPDLRVLVCTDLWYLNQAHLRSLPTISIGSPEVNALAAYLAPRLPSMLTVDGVFMIQMETRSGVGLASCWGIDPAATTTSVETFQKRLLEDFLECVPV